MLKRRHGGSARWLRPLCGAGVAAGCGVLPVAAVQGQAAAAEPAAPAWVEAAVRGGDGGDFRRGFAVEWDWLRQDFGVGEAERIVAGGTGGGVPEATAMVLEEAGARAGGLRREFDLLLQEGVPAGDRRWLLLYAHACAQRRAARLATLAVHAPRIAFVKRRTIRPSFFAYTEGQSDAQAERHFLPGSALCLLTLDGTAGRVDTLLEDPGGVIRDPAVSWDGRRLAFAWKRDLDRDDYHLHEMDLASGAVRQVTHGEGVADYEPAYLPDGDFIFASTRCVQTVDCWWTEVSNIYTCDPEGRHIRRLGFDQVHTVYPQVLDDGRVVYTRWDYNDRGQVFPQPLFQMQPDGTGQTEYYGNNSWFPTTIAHARGIPGTSTVLAILCGHHSSQAGKLAVIDPARGRQENQGVQLVSPPRHTPAERIDSYGQDGELFRHPYPLAASEWLVSYAPDGWEGAGGWDGDARFAVYWMDIGGRRELLAADAELPCQQPVAVAARRRPALRPSGVDLGRDDGVFYLQDIHQGPGLAGVARGTVRRLRVVALEYRPVGIRANASGGPGGGAMISTPVAIGNGSWDVKRVLGETPVHDDGSACFVVPARTPVYFQALDGRGRALQTMRSWSTLQPGEVAACVGCHEPKNSAPPAAAGAVPLALREPPRALEPFHGPPRGFSFAREIQPILDRHCTRCHRDRTAVLALDRCEGPPPLEAAPEARSPAPDRAFSLLGATIADEPAGRNWSDAYLVLTGASRNAPGGEVGRAFRGRPDGPLVNWISSQSVPTLLEPATAGAVRSGLLDLLERGHSGVRLAPAEYARLACWIDLLVPFCGDYTEANIWTGAEMEKYCRFAAKRQRLDEEEREAVRRLWDARSRAQAAAGPPGRH